MTTRREFFVQKQRKRYYRTVEIYHPTTGVERYVDGTIDPISFTLESDAPRNAGQTVEFEGTAFEYSQPEQSQSTITMDIQLGRVGTQIKHKLKQIKGADRAKSGEVIIREYIAGESDVKYKLELYIRNITMTMDGAAITCAQDDPSKQNVAEIYTSQRFPGLAESL
jgi:hypothetical protein